MLFDGIKLVEGSEVQNLVVDSGTAFPANPDVGELFYRTDALSEGLYTHNGTEWKRHVKVGDAIETLLPNIIAPGTFKSVTVDSKGRVTEGTNPSTLAGFGIIDAQPLDGDLTAIAQLSTTSGILRKTAANTWTLDTNSYITANQTISISGDATGTGTTSIELTLANTGVAAGTYKSVTVDTKGRVTSATNPTTLAGFGIVDAQPLDGDLTAISALGGSSGYLLKTGINTWTLDTNTYITGNENIEFIGDVYGDGTTLVTLTLSSSGVAPGTYGSASAVPVIAIDVKGRVTSATNTAIAIDTSAVTSGAFANARISQASVTQHQAALAIAESQITDGALLARNAGNETITGTWTFSNPVTVGYPTLAGHAATKLYVDEVAQGVISKPSVEIATTGPLTATYNNGAAGVGATLTGTGAFPTIDGVALTSTAFGENGVLVKNQANPAHNGRYNLTTYSPNWVLTRCGLCDEADEIPGAYVFVKRGTLYAGTGWVQVVDNPTTFTVGTGDIDVFQFSGAGTYTVGTGLTLNGTEFSITNTGVTPGTYKSVTVNAQGQITSATNPTTLAGYGITDAQPLDSDLTAIAGLSSSGIIARTGNGTAAARSIAVSGTGLSVTNADGVSGNPTITSNATSANIGGAIVARDGSGNFAANSITAAFLSGNGASITNLNMANAATGTLTVARGGTGATTLTGYVQGNGTAAMTASATIPGADISGNISGNAANVTGTVAVANGGTGAGSLTGYVKGNGTAAMTASASVPVADISGTLNVAKGGTGATTLTGYVKGNGTAAMTASATIPGADISGNISGNAANVTGTVAVANGGTGATSGENACDNLGAPRINPVTAKDGDINISGSVISVYANGGWRQIFPAVYS